MSKEEAIKELKEIRETGKFNMFTDFRRVMQHANDNLKFNLVSYVGNDFKKYNELLEEI